MNRIFYFKKRVFFFNFQLAVYGFLFRIQFLTKLRNYIKPFQVLCYSSGIIAAKDLQWDLFKLIIPCGDQKILELKFGQEKDTLLHLGVKANDPALIERLLVCYGIPTIRNLQNRDGKSVLEVAVERGYSVSSWTLFFLIYSLLN